VLSILVPLSPSTPVTLEPMSEARRMLRAFHRDPRDELVAEWPIEDLSLPELQQLFGVPRRDPMFDSFRVTGAQVEPLSRATGVSIDLQRYDYFVEADAR
jgi:hypothetical protein